MKFDFSDTNEWDKRVSEWKESTSIIPKMVREEIVKSKLEPTKPAQGPRSLMFDPLSIQFAMGYKDRRYSLAYETLKRIPQQLSVIGAIIQTRCNQVAAFSAPFRLNKSLGFAIKHKNPARLTTKGEREFIQSLERFIYNCGQDKPNPFSAIARDDFETFLRKIVRDSLMYDAMCVEIVPDKKGLPYEFLAVDASTIRLASSNLDLDFASAIKHAHHSHMGSYVPNSIYPNTTWPGASSPYKTMAVRNPEIHKVPSFTQIIHGQMRNTYTRDELLFGVRNPRTDIYVQGYGYSELEMLLTIITAYLYAEEWNRRVFSNGSGSKGILNIRGDSMGPDMLEAFKRNWRANMEGVENAHRTAILQSETGIDWIDLRKSNAEMEYSQYLEYLLKIACAVFSIDPAEINFDLKGGVQQTPLFESSQEWKLKASRDRGLKPMLKFIAKMINDGIVSKIDDHFSFDFLGLDELTEQEKHELRTSQVASYMTLNEIRRAEDLPEVENGDNVLNPTYIMVKQQEQAKQMQEQQMNAMSGGGGQQPASGGGSSAPAKGEGGQEQSASSGSQYADSFTKSISQPKVKVLEVSFDDENWISLYSRKEP